MRHLRHRTFDALGCHVHLATSVASELGPAEAVARRVLAAVDASCSRFRSDSDLSRVNALPGRWVRVGPLLRAAVRVALDVAHDTGGLVDPCLGAQMVSLGYDADLRVVRRRPHPRWQVPHPHPVDAWREVVADDRGIRVPPGVALDLGATAKAWAADLVAQSIVESLGVGVVVSVGGDVRIVPDEVVPAWTVEVAERPGGPVATSVRVDRGGVATSSTRVRRWHAGGVERHHLLDPRTGLPVTGPWHTVTATGPTCVAANAATTAALVMGDQASAWLQRRRVDARLVNVNGEVTRTGLWPSDALPPSTGASAGSGRPR